MTKNYPTRQLADLGIIFFTRIGYTCMKVNHGYGVIYWLDSTTIDLTKL